MVKTRILATGGVLALTFTCLAMGQPATALPSESGLGSAELCPAENRTQTAVGSIEFACVLNAASESGVLVHTAVPTRGLRAMSVPIPAATSLNCDPAAEPVRTIVSERQENIDFCVVYGQVNDPAKGTWSRSIRVHWTLYPGWPSAQNIIKTVPSDGSPTLRGTIQARKQRGILPPAPFSVANWINDGNDTSTGWLKDFGSGGSHSVAIHDLQVEDASKGYKKFIGSEIASHRFTCDSDEKRCFYPGGREAGL